jgi:deoxyinosine 3'endonuclease (endonuclease V)
VGKNPVFVSAGYLTDLPYAVEMTLACLAGERLPQPLHDAHLLSQQYRDLLGENTCRSSVRF